MTEYDYSPAAYERYIAQQTRVSNWVSDTLQHAYADPFVLSPTLRDRSFYDEPDGPRTHPHHRSNHVDQWSSGSSRPSRSRSRSYVDHAYHDRAPPSRHRSQSHSRSAPPPRDVQPIYAPHGAQQPYYSQPHGRAARAHASPPRNPQYPSPPARQGYVTQPPPGQIYHLAPNPPAPAPKDSLYRHPSQSRHPTKPSSQPYLLVQGGGPKAEYKRGPTILAPTPIRPHGQQPLLKRLLGFVTMSPTGGRSGNGRGPRGSSY